MIKYEHIPSVKSDLTTACCDATARSCGSNDEHGVGLRVGSDVMGITDTRVEGINVETAGAVSRKSTKTSQIKHLKQSCNW